MADLPVGNEVVLTGATAVTLLAAPGASTQRVVPKSGASVYNRDTDPRDITFQVNKGGTKSILWKAAGVVAGGTAVLPKVVVLDATNESLEVLTDGAAATTEPVATVAAMETT